MSSRLLQSESDPLEVPRQDGRAYLDRLRTTLGEPARLRAVRDGLARETTAFARQHLTALRPTWAPALLTLAKNIAAAGLALSGACWLVEAGLALLAAPLVLVAGLALYGLVTVLHDTLHGAFLPGRRFNRWLGELLAPLFFLDYESFRRSHLGHHRHNQSTAHDPKYPRVPRPRIGADRGESHAHGLAGPISSFPAPMAAWFRVAPLLLRLPRRLRHAVYVAFTLLSGAYTVLAYGGELALPARDWRSARPWLSVARSLVFYLALLWWSPVLGALALASLWVALSCVFLVFLTHLSPYQLYMKEDNELPLLFALNISDIRGGWLLRTLGNGFTDHHAAHHVFPFAPCYRLARAARWLEERFDGLKAPVLRIGSCVDTTAVFDGLTASTIRPRGVGWFLWDLPSGQFVRRAATGR